MISAPRRRPSSSRVPAAILALLSAAVAFAGFSIHANAQNASQRTLSITYVELTDDARYEPIRASERIILRSPQRPYHGAQVAIDDAAALARITGVTLALQRLSTEPGQIAAALTKARQAGTSLFLLDLPASAYLEVAAALKGPYSSKDDTSQDAIAFNVSAPQDRLRRELCSREIVHAIPSEAMRMDALVQHVISRKWRDILLLEGPEPEDADMAAALQHSAKKLGARIVAHQRFKLGHDPRDRDLNNPALLTAINRDYDIIFVADAGLEMARQLPFRTARPRPIAGSIGLTPEAWHWTWDRNGGPQLNGRYLTKSGGQRMESPAWAAWMAVKLISEAVLRTGSTDTKQIRQHIIPGSGSGSSTPPAPISFAPTSFDGAKGLAVSVRPWDQQLRQPMLLATELAVIATAPPDGFLHQTNRLDSLGDDAPETPCRLDTAKK